MRAREFINENKPGKISKKNRYPTVGLHLFTDGNYDRTYGLNRVMMAVASADGSGKIDMDSESWAGKRNTAHPYTDVEARMLKDAYKAAGMIYKDLNKGDNASDELDSTNTGSPIKPFKGYKK